MSMSRGNGTAKASEYWSSDCFQTEKVETSSKANLEIQSRIWTNIGFFPQKKLWNRNLGTTHHRQKGIRN